MASRYEQLLELYPDDQVEQMIRVRDALLADPTALDNRKDKDDGNEGAVRKTC